MRTVDGDEVDRTIRDGTEHRHQYARTAYRAIRQDSQVDEGTFCRELAYDEAHDTDRRDDCRTDDRGRTEPVLALPLLQHEDEWEESDGHEADSDPVALEEVAPPRRRRIERRKLDQHCDRSEQQI